MRDKRRSMGGGQSSSERASLREALRNRGGAKALVTPAQSEAEDSEDPKSGLAWLDLNAFSSTAVKHAIDKLRSDVEKQIDRVRAPGADTDAEASAGEEPAGAAAGEGAQKTLAGFALPDFRIGGASSSSSGSAAAPVAKPKAKGGLRAALQARGGVRRQDPKVLADLERVAEALEVIEGAEESSPSGTPPSPSDDEGRRTLSVVEEEVASPDRPGDDEAAPGLAIPRPPAPSPGSEASPQYASPRPLDGAASPAEAEAQPDIPAAGAAAADVVAADGEAAAGAADGKDVGAAAAGGAAHGEVAAEAADGGAAEGAATAADGDASDGVVASGAAAGEASEAAAGAPVGEAASGEAAADGAASGEEEREAPLPARRAVSSSAVDGLAAEEVHSPPRKLKVASLGADAWWLQGKKGEPEDQEKAIEAKADPRLCRGAPVGSKEPGKLNTLQEFWGGKKSQGFAAGPQLDKSNRLSKVEAQAALQRLVSAGSDLNEVRRLRKLIDQLE